MIKKSILILLYSCLITEFATAMPCEFGFICISKSGKYEIHTQNCSYTNKMHLRSVKINHKDIEDAKLGPAYDGTYSGNNGPLAFEINLKSEDGTSRILVIEIPPKSITGIIKEKFAKYLPGDYEDVYKESITCENTG